tara:strand:- start:19 stop:129 length:111 start_codon:yes stop_codon:yes gene_type:complete
MFIKTIQGEADSLFNQEGEPDTIFAQSILYVDRISI